MKVDIGFQPTAKPKIDPKFSPKPPAPRIASPPNGVQFVEFPDPWVQETLANKFCTLLGIDGQPHQYLVESHSWPDLSDGSIEGLHITLTYDWSQ